MRVELDPPKGPKEPRTLRFVESRSNRHVLTDVYLVNGDVYRWLHVIRPIYGAGGERIAVWGQPLRLWDGAGAEYHKKGYRKPPPPLTAEQQEALALLFQKLGIKPQFTPGAPVTGDWQI